MNAPLPLAAAALALLLVVVLGRGIERLTAPQPHVPMVATSLCAGLGAWSLAWLAFVPLGGGHTIMLAPLVGLATLALAGNHLRRWSRNKALEEHYWSLPILHTLLLAGWLPLLWLAGPSTLADFDNLHTLTTLARHGGWPAGGEQPFAYGTPGWHVVHQLPATVTAWAGQASIPATMVLSFFALLAVASLIPAMAGTTVKWSNLPLVAAPALLVTLAFAPLALPVPDATPGLLLAPLALAVGMLPLLRPGTLVTGWAALPHALALAWLALLHPLGVPAAGVVAVAWVVVGLYQRAPLVGLLHAASLLAVLPLLVVLMLAHALWPWQGLALASPQTALATLAAMVPWPLEGPLWKQVLHLASLCLLALPVWLVTMGYEGSALAHATRRHPWFYAMPLVALAVAAGMALHPYVATQPDPVISYAQTVAEDVQAKKIVPPNHPVAVAGFSPLAHKALQYYLPHNPVMLVSATVPLASFHANLRKGGQALLWLGPEAAQTLFRMSGPPAASLFAEATESGLTIRAIYPMPQAR